jgi:hypothetical protein
MTANRRAKAIELSARFALMGEDPMISVSRAEMFFDFLSAFGRWPAEPAGLSAARSVSAALSGSGLEGLEPSDFRKRRRP